MQKAPAPLHARAALAAPRPDIALISQSYDEFHHLATCDLTYEGGTREMLRRCAHGEADGAAFARYWNESAYSFPRGALRMRWLEDKEQGRASAFLGRAAHRPAAAVLLAMDGVPHILMGQEFDEPSWTGWPVLFDAYQLNWKAFDGALYAHYQTLIGLRRRHAGAIWLDDRNDRPRARIHWPPTFRHQRDGDGVARPDQNA